MAKKNPVKIEIERLKKVYSSLPEKQLAVVEGLIIQAARLRVDLDKLALEIEKEGLTQLFSQSDKTPPYKRITPAADLFIKLDKNYQAIIRQLNDLTPPDESVSALEAFKASEDDE